MNSAAGNEKKNLQSSENIINKNEDDTDDVDIWNITYHCDLKMKITRAGYQMSKPRKTTPVVTKANSLRIPTNTPTTTSLSSLKQHRQHYIKKTNCERSNDRKKKLVDILIS